MADEQPSQEILEAQFEALKDKARTLGINPGNMGSEALRKAINEKTNPVVAAEPTKEMGEMTEMELRNHLRLQALKLVRVKVFNNNPSKVDLQGELICVGNKYIGMQRKMIPFGDITENGYHIPQIIFDELKQRKYQQIITKKVNGRDEVTFKMAPEYTIEVLPPLTKEELSELALKQAAAERLGA